MHTSLSLFQRWSLTYPSLSLFPSGGLGRTPAFAFSELVLDAPYPFHVPEVVLDEHQPVLVPEVVLDAPQPVPVPLVVLDEPLPVPVPVEVLDAHQPVLVPEVVFDAPRPVLVPEDQRQNLDSGPAPDVETGPKRSLRNRPDGKVEQPSEPQLGVKPQEGSPEETPRTKMLFLPAAALCCLCSALVAMAAELVQDDVTLTRRVGQSVSFSCGQTYQCDGKRYHIFGPGSKLYVTDEQVVKPVVSVYPAASRVHLGGGSSLLCVASAMFPPGVRFSWKRQKKNGPLEDVPPAEGEQVELREPGRSASIMVVHRLHQDTYIYSCYVKHEGGTVEAQTQGDGGSVTVFSRDSASRGDAVKDSRGRTFVPATPNIFLLCFRASRFRDLPV
ncbi:uncharacterized protein LOC133452169 [Cololabis saira]|uniref:uncharacterized protein LOC133452169 n=1 Tax=Cololabis saira TaxID=129043 RepID=UPI002AD3954D|nr:uncharacterized protein LOC133452169 [Cololabis saira]